MGIDLEDVMWRAGCDGDEVNVSGPEAQALVARLKDAEARLRMVRELREGDLCSHCLGEVQDAIGD